MKTTQLLRCMTVGALAFVAAAASAQTPAVAPVITAPPASLLLTAGATASFTVAATGTAPLRYQWFRNDVALRDAESATLSLGSARLADAGVYTVRVSNSAGAVTSAGATLTVNATAGVITTALANQTVAAGANVTFTVATAGTGLTYQWRFKGRPIKDETTATLRLNNVSSLSAGLYTVNVANATGTVATSSAQLGVTVDARLANISTRGHVGEDDEVLITGFVVRGGGTKKVLVRGVGPTLAANFGVTGALAAPRLTLYRAGRETALAATDGGWGGSAAIAATFAQVGAFPLPAASADAALVTDLAAGAYSAHLTAPRGSTGIALAELYDADTGSPATEIVNISTRAHVGAEAADTLIAGFAIKGTTSTTVLVRGVGPSLGTLFGMRRALGASHVAVYDSTGAEVAANTIWGGRDNDRDDDMDDACDRAGAWRLPRGSTDSALLLTLKPGVYTAHVTGVNRRSGIALVEVFEVR